MEQTEEQGRPLPSFVRREVEAYLRCGMLEHGLLRLGCPACGFERLVAFSCCLQLKTMRSLAVKADNSCHFAMIALLIVLGLQAKR